MNLVKCRRCGAEYDYDAPESAIGSVDELCPQCLMDGDSFVQQRFRRIAEEEREIAMSFNRARKEK